MGSVLDEYPTALLSIKAKYDDKGPNNAEELDPEYDSQDGTQDTRGEPSVEKIRFFVFLSGSK